MRCVPRCQPGVREVALGSFGNPFGRIGRERRHLQPLEGGLQNGQPAPRGVVGDAEIASELAVVDLLAGVRRAQADETGEQPRVFHFRDTAHVALDVRSHVGRKQVGENLVVVVQVPSGTHPATDGLPGSARSPAPAAVRVGAIATADRRRTDLLPRRCGSRLGRSVRPGKETGGRARRRVRPMLSLTERSSMRFMEPVSRYWPGVPSSSTRRLITASKSGAYCTSSKISGGRYWSRNSSGSSRALPTSITGSNTTRAATGATCASNVLLPDCRAPITRTTGTALRRRDNLRSRWRSR